MFNVAHAKVENIRELSKKEKFLGLNLNSWILCTISVLPIANMTFFYGLILFFVLISFFYVAEFFDEDITDIIFASFNIKGIDTYYA
ncbi:virB3 type IV secretion protein [Helicobacter cappadocius]|uniref:VirB3 type IV secretion protein n=1 Tax=Helicobacter cappadocius TaxID=3063998 RepID=A0AA90SSE4_9HELI|nr:MULTISPECIES: virB3 type IV secretion protein [unclassified Helicobacter]MDO7253085.1 virB3 type IV secretion protein [Helicobacter sp. faydin-H75]MDP2538789.1 virB3 type IV secretion protein [Helicobacter sp. faydin-H76]